MILFADSGPSIELPDDVFQPGEVKPARLKKKAAGKRDVEKNGEAKVKREKQEIKENVRPNIDGINGKKRKLEEEEVSFLSTSHTFCFEQLLFQLPSFANKHCCVELTRLRDV